MANGIEAEVVHESLTSGQEIVRESDSDTSMQDVDVAMQEYVANKRAEHPEWYTDTKAPVEDSTPKKTEPKPEKTKAAKAEEDTSETEEDADEQAGSEAAEPQSESLRRILSREAKLRKAQQEFETQQKSFDEKLAQVEVKLQAYEDAKRLAKVDPASLLESLGLGGDDFIDIARTLYYRTLGDLAPDEFKGKQDQLALRREIEQLKLKLEDKAKPQEADAQIEALKAYQEELLVAAENVDIEAHPNIAEVLSNYSVYDVAADMYAIASEYAQEKQGRGAPLSPKQILARLEPRYAELLNKQVEDKPQETVKKVPARRNTTLSNSLNKQQPNTSDITPDMSYEEIAKAARARFNKLMGGG